MSEYDLIPDETYDNLPSDASEKFTVLVRVAQSNLARLLDQSNSSDFAAEVRSQFMSIVGGIAEALGIEGLPILDDDLANYSKYQTFQVYLAGIVARTRLQGQLVARPDSVQLGRVTRAKIQQDIDQLRYSISNSDIEKNKKDTLRDKLGELETELARQRLSFARTMAITASIMAIIGSGTAALANAPKAKETIVHILQLIGEDKAKEEEERLRLAPPPKALPDYRTGSPQPKDSVLGDLDDEIPF
jgi:hypothetical protein